ncbi:efflux RND transporter periplasmic adaptor subunit [Leptolyngbya iicbica]|uniref:Efflux RND transporter periplasmic adaptor subunit n=2 Tax=Cyanophyceae TaxID=3028117 RepID=A0A4Q7E0G6_9CYAN|nr:efflux RND transporter periplasmic adaptor subunit [Leptolyngbya sp. LK]RZM74828.1 efflux RND transporter periplasmic adaptor subunit [Leptolyngbya sp. LK]
MTSNYARLSATYRLPLAAGGLMLMASLAGLVGCTNGEGGGRPPQAAMAEEMVSVNTQVAQVGTFEAGLTFTGTTQPVQTVALRSRVTGQVTALTVDVADAVANGDILARQDADLLTVAVNQAQAELQARQSEVAQAQAAVSDAQTAYNSALVRLQQAQTEADRLTRLAADGAVSIQTAEQAQLTVDTGQQVVQSTQEQIRTRQAAVSAAEGRVSAQQAVVDQAQERLSYAVVRSPLSGTVIERFVEVGDYAETGDELMQLGDLSSIKVVIEVSDRDLAQVSVGQPVDVQLDALPGETIGGRITRIAPAADPTSRLIPVEVTIPNATGRIGSGLLARVTLEGAGSDRIAIPKPALEIASDDAPTLFVLTTVNEQEATVAARPVEVGRENDSRVEILSGLQADEVVVVRSSGDLSDGQVVKLSILSETE